MTLATQNLPTGPGPAWEIARIFPDQGDWSDHDYLQATRHTRQLVELNDGHIEVLPMPSFEHQRILGFLYRFLWALIAGMPDAEVVFAPAKVRLRTGKYREPDLIVRLGRSPEDTSDFAVRVDIAVELISPGHEAHDLVTKRAEYAEAVIPEYWIIDPEAKTVPVLTLDPIARSYAEHGRFRAGQIATSRILSGCQLPVDALLAAAR